MNSTDLFDEGLQPERTLLAWQRTLLAVAVGCAVAARLVAPQVGIGGVVASLSGILLVAVTYLAVRRRYARINTSLRASDTLQLLSAWPLALLTLVTVVLGILAVAFVLLDAPIGEL